MTDLGCLSEDPFADLMNAADSLLFLDDLDYPPPAQPLTLPGHLNIDESGSAYVFPIELPAVEEPLPTTSSATGQSAIFDDAAGDSSVQATTAQLPRPVRKVYRCRIRFEKERLPDLQDVAWLPDSESAHLAADCSPRPSRPIGSFENALQQAFGLPLSLPAKLASFALPVAFFSCTPEECMKKIDKAISIWRPRDAAVKRKIERPSRLTTQDKAEPGHRGALSTVNNRPTAKIRPGETAVKMRDEVLRGTGKLSALMTKPTLSNASPGTTAPVRRKLSTPGLPQKKPDWGTKHEGNGAKFREDQDTSDDELDTSKPIQSKNCLKPKFSTKLKLIKLDDRNWTAKVADETDEGDTGDDDVTTDARLKTSGASSSKASAGSSAKSGKKTAFSSGSSSSNIPLVSSCGSHIIHGMNSSAYAVAHGKLKQSHSGSKMTVSRSFSQNERAESDESTDPTYKNRSTKKKQKKRAATRKPKSVLEYKESTLAPNGAPQNEPGFGGTGSSHQDNGNLDDLELDANKVICGANWNRKAFKTK